MSTVRNVEEGLPSGRNGRERPFLKWAAFLVIVLLALAIRVPRLADRPMHTDEAVNAYLIGKILEGEPYRYDPTDHHGPLYFALSDGICRLAGSGNLAALTAEELRLPAVLSSLLGILFFIPFSRVAGAAAAGFAALLWALDPLCVYYGRYAIHESLFLSLTFGFLVSILLARSTRAAGWFCMAGLCAGAMIATKATSVVAFAAAAAAMISLRGKPAPGWREAVLFVLSGAAVVLLCFTWGFRNWSAFGEIFAAVGHACSRAGGQGHEKPFIYYWELFLGMSSGPPTLALAIAGGWLAWRGTAHREAGRFLSIYALVVFLLYSLIPYKTPWLLLNIWLPLALLAALALSFLWRRSRLLSEAAMLVLGFFISKDLDDRVFRHAAGESNPLAYSHTSEDIRNLSGTMERLQKQAARPLRIAVMADDPWPLPWYLRSYPQVGYWRPGDAMPEADIVILDQAEAERLQLESKGWRPSIFCQRPGALLLIYERAGKAGR